MTRRCTVLPALPVLLALLACKVTATGGDEGQPDPAPKAEEREPSKAASTPAAPEGRAAPASQVKGGAGSESQAKAAGATPVRAKRGPRRDPSGRSELAEFKGDEGFEDPSSGLPEDIGADEGFENEGKPVARRAPAPVAVPAPAQPAAPSRSGGSCQSKSDCSSNQDCCGGQCYAQGTSLWTINCMWP